MKNVKMLLFGLIIGLFLAPAAWALPTVDLQEWAFKLNGTIYDSFINAPTDLPVSFDISDFDFPTGLGTVKAAFTAPGTYDLASFFDHEMNQFVNGFMDEFGAQVGTRPTGLSFQMETPNDVYYNWFEPFDSTHPLQNAVEFGPAQDGTGLPPGVQTPNDQSMALGWNFTLAAGEIGLVTFTVGFAAPSGFYLQQSDPGFVGTGPDDPSADPGSIYFSSDLNVQPAGVPEPSAILLLVAGLVSLGMGKCRLLKGGVL